MRHPASLVRLLLTIYRGRPVIARSMRVANEGRQPVELTTAISASLDLPDADWHLAQLTGAWGRECHVTDAPLMRGRRALASRHGASSHYQNPFLLLRRPATTEDSGEAIGLSLVYSGNFLAEVEVDPFDYGPRAPRPGPRDVLLAAGSRARSSRRPRPCWPGVRRAWVASRRPTTGSTASASCAAPGGTARVPSSSTAGKGSTTTSTRTGWSRWPPPRRTSASSSSSSMTAGSASATTTPPRSATGPSMLASCPPACPRSCGASTTWPGLRDLDRAGDGQPPQPPLRGPPRVGRRHPWPDPLGAAQPVRAGPLEPSRSSITSSRPWARSWPARRSPTSSGT